MTDHHYELTVEWTGNQGHGTRDYRTYGREHVIVADGKPAITASADPAFRGDAALYNPEELLVASLAGCHMLWYLHLCADAGIVVTAYRDRPTGTMRTDRQGGRMSGVTLRPEVTITDAAATAQAVALHDEANRRCFVANSVNFPVQHEASIAT